ncbi:MarR family transcriptional regulator [Nocardiopsis sp. RSe5-2]|uniref:MarR family transcriptional regulator n=1 Tax=Nocardiopsis endophytica TaxID=3018445 RepID=A0ABT4U880_9ACTN|nr:MarR family transcriptional regulator [Nocardiopsis endophytica]MDA2812659.1 MarR family transcriptional regulator [Nocardiopsis endophytica]
MGKQTDGPMDVATALVRTSFLVDAVYAEASGDYGITPQQGNLLCVLMAQPHGMGELGGMLRLAKSSLTGLVDRTARRGLVRRETAPDDGRAVVIALTEEGAEVAAEFYADACRRIAALTDGLDEEARTGLTALLEQVVTENHVPEVFTGTAE